MTKLTTLKSALKVITYSDVTGPKEQMGAAPCISKSTKEVLNFSNNFCEGIVVTIAEIKLILGVIYRPPKCPYDKFQSVMSKIQDCITNITEKSEDWSLALLGDLNFPEYYGAD